MLFTSTQIPPFSNLPSRASFQQYYPSAVDIDFDFDIGLDIESEDTAHSLSSPLYSTQSYLVHPSAARAPHAPLSNSNVITPGNLPRTTQSESQFPVPMINGSSASTSDIMSPDTWLPSNPHFASKPSSRISHHRESSLSSLGSTGPASPYSQNTSNPQIAVTDLVGDGYHGLSHGLSHYYDDSTYPLTKSLASNTDSFYANHASFASDAASAANYAGLAASQKTGVDRNLLPPPELFTGSNRSRPVSVASSVASDSPATPLPEQPEDERRPKNAFHSIPKLDRTMTDIYADELYSPSFTITSTAPSQSHHIPVSPSQGMFAQRLQAINSQHLSVAHSPASPSPREKSPFRHGSSLAPASSQEIASNRFGSAQQLREQREAEQEARALRQMSRNTDTATPQTISPKDAMLEFHEGEGGANYPLFPQQPAGGFEANQLDKVVSDEGHAFNTMALEDTSFNYLSSPIAGGLQVPQQYPFVAHPRRQDGNIPMANSSTASPAESTTTASGSEVKTQRPPGVSADGGTYTCTYHGCSFRFDTPALLQKHKREGHRQPHGLNGNRRAEGSMATGLLNSQAGPHRCDRINPSTGKPCNTIFSRPYDLTRHEDTIHNARKLKVRCNLCTEDKTFSRADALTRHYRVCHPDVDFPGKHRRRGAHSS